MKKQQITILISLLLFTQAVVAISLSYKQISESEYVWVVENDSALEIDEAQRIIYNGALEMCKGLSPVYGKYKFESSEKIISDEVDNESDTYLFTQNIQCVESMEIQQDSPKSILNIEQENEIKIKAKKLTKEYLSAKENKEFKKAYAMLTKNMQEMSDFKTWRKRESKTYADYGREVASEIWRMTVYDNPPNSPKPGVYVAADYESSFVDTPIHCGYVMWFLPIDNLNDFKVMREEYGSITNKIMKQVHASELPQIRQQIGCRATK